MAPKVKRLDPKVKTSNSKRSVSTELPAISAIGYSQAGAETQRRIEMVKKSLAEARKELNFK